MSRRVGPSCASSPIWRNCRRLRLRLWHGDEGPLFRGPRWNALEDAEALPKSLDHEATSDFLVDVMDKASDAIQMACAELLSRGLLHDAGIGRWNGKSDDSLCGDAAAVTFLSWIQSAALSATVVHGARLPLTIT